MSKKPCATPEEWLIALQDTSLSDLDIAIRFGCKLTTVRLKARKLKLRPRIRRVTSDRVENIKAMFKDGHSCKRIAEDLNCSYRSVRRVVQRLRLRERPRIDWQGSIYEIQRMREQGHTVEEICKPLGVNRFLFYRNMKRLGFLASKHNPEPGTPAWDRLFKERTQRIKQHRKR